MKSKMRGGPTIGDMYNVVFGLKSGDDKKFIHRTKDLHKEDRPLLRGDDVRRYGFRWNGEYIWYVPNRMRKHRSTARPGEAARFEQPKVLVKDTTKDFACTYEPGQYYVKDVLIVIPREQVRGAYDLRFLAGVINSSARRFFYRTTFTTLHVQNGELASLPLPVINLDSTEDTAKYNLVIQLVEAMLECTAQLNSAVTDADVDRLQKRCEALDARIDQTIDGLYGLSADDRHVVNRTLSAGANKRAA